MAQRDPKFDIMKGLGIILVILGHCGMELGHYIIYMFHMPLFFYVSGHLHRDKPLVQGIKSKFTALAVPYIIFFAVCAVFDYFIFADDPEYYINPLAPKNSGGPLWFLFAMLWVYIAFLVLNKFVPRYTFIICLATSIGSYLLSVYDVSLPLYLDSAASCLIFYAIGFYTHRLNYRFTPAVGVVVSLASLCGLYALYILDFSNLHLVCNDLVTNDIMENYSLFILSALVGIVFIESTSMVIADLNLRGVKAWLCRIGSLSLYIFAFHLLVINIMNLSLDATSRYYYFILVVTALTVSVIVGLLMEKRTNALIKTLNSKW